MSEFKQDEVKIGSVVKIISSDDEMSAAFSGVGYIYNKTMSSILGKTVTVVDRPQNNIFGLPSCIQEYHQPVWWYPFTAIQSIISTKPLPQPILSPAHHLPPDNHSSLIVFGYIHNEQKRLRAAGLMPDGVTILCMSYYHNPEFFAMTPECIQLSHNDLCITKTEETENEDVNSDPFFLLFGPNQNDNRWHNTSFGNVVVRPGITDQMQYVYQWKLQMMHALHSSFIGITTSTDINVAFCNKYGSTFCNIAQYGYRTFSGEIECNAEYQSYGEPLVTGDVLTMELDEKNARLRFQRNEDKPREWIDVVHGKHDYKMAVSICKDDIVSLIDFKRTKIA